MARSMKSRVAVVVALGALAAPASAAAAPRTLSMKAAQADARQLAGDPTVRRSEFRTVGEFEGRSVSILDPLAASTTGRFRSCKRESRSVVNCTISLSAFDATGKPYASQTRTVRSVLTVNGRSSTILPLV